MVFRWGIIQYNYIFLRGGNQGEDKWAIVTTQGKNGHLQTKENISATPGSWTSRTNVCCSVSCGPLLGNHARELHGPVISVELSDAGGGEVSSRDKPQNCPEEELAQTVGCGCHSINLPTAKPALSFPLPFLSQSCEMSDKIATGSEGTAVAQRELRSLS